MKDITLLAVDIAKNIFQLHGVDKHGKCILKKRLRRAKLMETIAQLNNCIIVMESCGSSNYWGRRMLELGHEVKLINPRYVKPFLKGNKNDGNDAEAIAEAASRPSMRFTRVKTLEQQDIAMLHRMRERFLKEKIAQSNQIRGILAEYGIVIRQGFSYLSSELPVILARENSGLSKIICDEIQNLYEHYKMLSEKVKHYEKRIKLIYKQNEVCQRIGEVEGVGVLSATAILALGDLSHLKNGRNFSAFIGLVPKQHSSGNKQKLLGLSKRGNVYIRKLLIHGARSVLLHLNDKSDSKSLWLKELVSRRGTNRAAVALANKNARVIWKLITSDETYNPTLISTH